MDVQAKKESLQEKYVLDTIIKPMVEDFMDEVINACDKDLGISTAMFFAYLRNRFYRASMEVQKQIEGDDEDY